MAKAGSSVLAVKAPSTKATGTVLTLALVLVSVVPLASSAPVATPLSVVVSLPTDTAATSVPATQSSSKDRVDPAREAALPPPEPALVRSPFHGLGESLRLMAVWEASFDLLVALRHLMEASNAMQVGSGTESEFRKQQREYVLAAVKLEWESVAARAQQASSATNSAPGTSPVWPVESGDRLQRYADDAPGAVVIAFRRHFLDAFNGMSMSDRRFLLRHCDPDRERATGRRNPPDESFFSARGLEALGFRPLPNCWMLVEL